MPNYRLSSGQIISDQDPNWSTYMNPTSGAKPTLVPDAQIPQLNTTPSPSANPNTNFNQIANDNKANVGTSAPAVSDMNGIDDKIANLPVYEEPTNTDATAKLIEAERKRNDEAYQARQTEIKAGTTAKVNRQEGINQAIAGSSRLALASMGILSDTPELITSTNAMQYINDVKVEGEKEIQNILSEEQSLLNAAKNARDDKDFALAKQLIDQADAARKERNTLKQQIYQDILAMKEAERAGDAATIAKLQEDRAAKKFNTDTALQTLDILSKTDFKDFAEYTMEDKNKLELALGLPKGTLDNYAENAIQAKTVAGWSSPTMYNDKTTGEVKAIYTRINPTTGQPENMVQSLGKVGERYQVSSTSNNDALLDSQRQSIQADVAAIRGSDNKLDTAKYAQIRENVAVNSPKLLSWFDETYNPQSVLNPNDPTAKTYFQTTSQMGKEEEGTTNMNDYLKSLKDQGYTKKDIENDFKNDADYGKQVPEFVKTWLKNNF